jgi:ABC-type antimicrobial peptide transport system permease subunit
MVLGLIFNMINVLFIGISSILIYSLLNITAAQKKFDNGILRLIGMTKSGFIAMIMLQSVTFVLPSLFLAICGSFPLIYLVQKAIFTAEMDFVRAPVPSATAFLQAIIIALLIPSISATVPIFTAVKMTLVEFLNSSRVAGISVTI